MADDKRVYRFSRSPRPIWQTFGASPCVSGLRRKPNAITAASSRRSRHLRTAERRDAPLDVREDCFKYPIGSHVIYFRVADDGIDVIRVLHQRMDVSRHL